jgi:hypothetical protein
MQENIVYRHKITFFSRLLQTKKDDALTSHDMMTPRCRWLLTTPPQFHIRSNLLLCSPLILQPTPSMVSVYFFTYITRFSRRHSPSSPPYVAAGFLFLLCFFMTSTTLLSICTGILGLFDLILQTGILFPVQTRKKNQTGCFKLANVKNF